MEEVGNIAMPLPVIECVTMGVSAVVVTEEIVSSGVGMTVFSTIVSIREFTEPDAVVIGVRISVDESRGMLLVVKGGVWATTAVLVLGADVTIGDVGIGVALLMKEVSTLEVVDTEGTKAVFTSADVLITMETNVFEFLWLVSTLDVVDIVGTTAVGIVDGVSTSLIDIPLPSSPVIIPAVSGQIVVQLRSRSRQ